MTDYVLVHGAWHGSWCWKRVRQLLTVKGHQVFTPTLTGLEEKVETTLRDDQTITMLINNPGVTSTAIGSNENGGLK
jgi:hypothetical protein